MLTPLSSGLVDRQLEWVKANEESPWAGAIRKSALGTVNLVEKRFKLDWVSVSAERVAREIVKVVGQEKPVARRVIATLDQHIIFRLTYHLPTWLGDRIMLAIA